MQIITANSRKHGAQQILVDDEDYDLVSQYTWSVRKDHKMFYAFTQIRKSDGTKTTMQMHRLIMGLDGPLVDHENHNGLDNRRENLRHATQQQNKRNQRIRKNTSGFKGVRWDKGKWQARIMIDGIQLNIGRYFEPLDAARAYDAAARQYHGEFASINFPS